jgi:hypothetical protein
MTSSNALAEITAKLVTSTLRVGLALPLGANAAPRADIAVLHHDGAALGTGRGGTQQPFNHHRAATAIWRPWRCASASRSAWRRA